MGSGAAAQLADGPKSDPLSKKEGGKDVEGIKASNVGAALNLLSKTLSAFF